MQTFRVFVSSPGDVMVERRRVENVVSRLNGEFAGVARLETIRWETKFYQAFSTFQTQIPHSTECDLVIGILKWRLGTELPPDFNEKLPNGQPFPSGTAYEILTAIEKRQKGAKLPDIYVFRFAGSSPSVAVDDPNRTGIEHDWQALKGFFEEWFLTEQGHFKAAFNSYTSEDDFEAQLEKLLRNWVADKMAGGSLEHVVTLSRLSPAQPIAVSKNCLTWESLLDHPPVAATDFQFEQVPFDHPLWILFSSGTTGLPKPIVHGHGGIIIEMFKALCFHMDLHPGERAFFFTTTGWMMWNVVASMLMVGACPVLYDGNPGYPTADALWRMADDCGVAFFGVSPSYVDNMRKTGVVPRTKFDLTRLRAIMPAGSPVSAECTAWFYSSVKSTVWVTTGSGGTDCCTGLVGGVPTLPVYAGEIQARQLGVAVAAFDEDGKSVIGEVGELVITKPIPSMPVCFWGDTTGERYREAYFDMFPGVWRHGDLLRINSRGGCFVLGRSDATLNRHGVRIGTAEIYRTLSSIDAIFDSLIVNLDLPGGKFFMPLFVQLQPGRELDGDLQRRINDTLRRNYTPRHVPDRIIAVPEIPYTLTGKKMEVPVRRILMGASPDKVLNRNAMANPHTLDEFVAYARSQRDYSIAI